MSTTLNHNPNKNLELLDNLEGYKVHHDDTDPRGYKVVLPSGETIGEVEGLLADINAKLVRYVEVEIDDDVIKRHTFDRYDAADKHALVPVGLIQINEANNTVTMHGLTLDQIIDYPRFPRQRGYTTRYEVDTNDYLAGFHDYGSSYDRDRYSTDHHRDADSLDDAFYDSNFYRNPSSNDRL
ncbi:hypothetical protein GGR28_000261 [Lewinella aquimaris]|uniref:PRC-barrel domain-containing protein n=1 Tax=Neolewinella aquimaris TaxID=1835722 RepID=A0A840DXJ9_9BACT|nr:PRC-barrel domain-containing protein [Neolewinella aquimaris]MBB4077660.1 hypothetical protein [Neolewinella aquimaris]